jgi:hypothetical protein
MAILQAVRIESRSWLLAAATLAFVALVMIVPAPAQPSREQSGEVIAIRELKLKAGIDLNQFEQFVASTYNPAWEGAVPGMKGYIAKGDRGVQKGGYALFLIFDTEKTRNAIFPKAGSGASERFAPMLQKAFALNQELDKFIEPGSLSAYTDFVVMR